MVSCQKLRRECSWTENEAMFPFHFWTSRNRRMSNDDERKVQTSETLIPHGNDAVAPRSFGAASTHPFPHVRTQA